MLIESWCVKMMPVQNIITQKQNYNQQLNLKEPQVFCILYPVRGYES